MNFLYQALTAMFCLAVFSFLFRKSVSVYLLLISLPIIYFYHFSLMVLVSSLILGVLLKLLLNKNPSSLNVIIFSAFLFISLLLSGHKIYRNIAIENVSNSQRGEHSNYQSNLLAKVLHNKSTAIIYYIWNLNDRLSPSAIFTSGSYPDFSKYLFIGYLFPWYLFGFLAFIKNSFNLYLKPRFLIPLTTLLVFSAVFERSTADIFVFSLIWFIAFVSVDQIEKLPKYLVFLIILANLFYLGMYLLPVSVMWNI